MRSQHSLGDAPYPTVSPMQTYSSTFSFLNASITAVRASMLACTSLKIPIRMNWGAARVLGEMILGFGRAGERSGRLRSGVRARQSSTRKQIALVQLGLIDLPVPVLEQIGVVEKLHR